MTSHQVGYILQPRPVLAVYDRADVGLRDAELVAEFGLSPTSACVASADIEDVGFGEFSLPRRGTSRLPTATFCFHVPHVVSVRSEEEVIGVDAISNIAAMEDTGSVMTLPRRDRTIVQNP